jgi:hypothetical protein
MAIFRSELILNLELSQACLLQILLHMITEVDQSLMFVLILVRISETKFEERFSTWLLMYVIDGRMFLRTKRFNATDFS